jgi:hypothetical protein
MDNMNEVLFNSKKEYPAIILSWEGFSIFGATELVFDSLLNSDFECYFEFILSTEFVSNGSLVEWNPISLLGSAPHSTKFTFVGFKILLWSREALVE